MRSYFKIIKLNNKQAKQKKINENCKSNNYINNSCAENGKNCMSLIILLGEVYVINIKLKYL